MVTGAALSKVLAHSLLTGLPQMAVSAERVKGVLVRRRPSGIHIALERDILGLPPLGSMAGPTGGRSGARLDRRLVRMTLGAASVASQLSDMARMMEEVGRKVEIPVTIRTRCFEMKRQFGVMALATGGVATQPVGVFVMIEDDHTSISVGIEDHPGR